MDELCPYHQGIADFLYRMNAATLVKDRHLAVGQT
jgi:hypothetical protein